MMFAVTLATLGAAGQSSAQDLVPVRVIVRKFPNGFCPIPDIGVQFTAISNKVTVEFSANTSYLGTPVEIGLDNLCIADASQVTGNRGQCLNCESYANDTGGDPIPVDMFLFDNFDPNGQVITWLEKFDTNPAGRGWDMTHGAVFSADTSADCGGNPTGGSLKLVSVGPCADSLARTSITVTGLIPGQSYYLTGFWSAPNMTVSGSVHLKIRITDTGYNLSQSAWGASVENQFRITHDGFSRQDHFMVPDGQGGAIALWAEQQNDYDIYAQHFLANGTIAPGWPSNGIALTTFTGDQLKPYAVPDGAGGAIVAWEDRRNGQGDPDVYAQRIRGDGTIAAGWPTPASGGLLIAASVNTAQKDAKMVPTSDGGAVIAWTDGRSGTSIDVYAKRITASGGLATGWTAGGLAVCTAAGNEVLGALASDGADGAFVTFQVHPTSSYDVCLQRVTGAGAIAAGWPASTTTGVAIGSTTGADEIAGGAVPDGSGGVFVSWHAIPESSPRVQRRTSAGALATGWLAGGKLTCASGCDGSVSGSYLVRDGSDGVIVGYKNALSFDHRYFAQRLTGAGVVAPGWPSTRATLTNTLGTKLGEMFASDGLGGAYMSWFESSNTTNAFYAQRISGSGTLPTGWTANGRAISEETGYLGMAATPADSSALLVAFTDFSSLVKAHRIDRHGQMGYPGPSFTSIADHAADQGGSVDLKWSAGDLINVTSFRTGGQYRFWRATEGSQPPVWQLLGNQAATDLCTRVFVAGTPNIAVGGTATKTRYRLEAFEPSTGRSWFSYPDSAFSTDNLAPAVPTGLTGLPGGPGVSLHWHRSTEADLSKYRVYKGSAQVFPINSSTLVGEPTDTAFVAPITGPSYFRLSAVDTHGNEGPAAPPIGPFDPLDVGDAPPAVLALAPPMPNPSSRGTTIGYSLPERAPVTLAIYDVSGRVVRTLVRGEVPAGQHVARWDGADDGGQRVKSSIYFVRFTALGKEFTRRVAMFQ
jgi:FlgD Ig-like domain